MDYPHINEPQRQADGTYQVQVERAPGDFKSVAYPDKASAARGVQALRAGAELLVDDGIAVVVDPGLTVDDLGIEEGTD